MAVTAAARTSVPRPSAAKADAVSNFTCAVPSATARKVTEARFERDENGEGLPPPNSIVPALFENVGSVVQSEKTEPVFEMLTTDKVAGSKEIFASTAFTLAPLGST